jgi:hypothetical protein
VVSNVGLPFFIVTLGLFDGKKASCLIEESGSLIALKRPEIEAFGIELICLTEEPRAGSMTEVSRVDVKLIDPTFTDAHHPDNFDPVLDHPYGGRGTRAIVASWPEGERWLSRTWQRFSESELGRENSSPRARLPDYHDSSARRDHQASAAVIALSA